MSKPFVQAAALDTIGMGILLGAVVPFAGVVARRLGAGPELLTLLSVAPFIGFLAAAPAARLSFRFRWGPLLGVLRVLGRGLLLTFLWVRTPLVFVIVLVASNVAGGCAQTISGSLLKAHVPGRARGNVLKWLSIAACVAAVPAAWAAGAALDLSADNYRYVFAVAGLAALLTSLKTFGLPERSTDAVTREGSCGLLDELRVLNEDRVFALFILAFFVGTTAEKIGLPITPIYFADVLNMRYQDVGLALGLVGPALAVAGYLFWGWSMKRWSPLTVLIICMFLKGLRPALWALAAHAPHPLHLIVAGEAIFRFTVSGMGMSVMLIILQMSDRNRVPLYVGIHFFLMGVRGLAGPVLGLTLYKLNPDITRIYWLIAAVVFCGGIALLLFAGTVRSKK